MGNCVEDTTQITKKNKKKESLRIEDFYVSKPQEDENIAVFKHPKAAAANKNKKFDINVEDYEDKKMSQVQQFIDDNYRDFKSLEFIGDRSIKAKCGAYVFGRSPMTVQSSFKIIFTSIMQYVSVGVVDARYKKKPILDTNTRNWITYCSDGRYYLGGKKMSQTAGFKVGEQITVLVDRKIGEVQWIIGTQTIFQTKFSGLNDKALNWVPFIELKQPNDAFTICH